MIIVTSHLTEIIQNMQEQNVDTGVLKEILEEIERKRTIMKELVTLKVLPNEAKMPQLMTNAEMEEEVEEENESSIDGLSPHVARKMNVQMSIRSIAGIRALRVCEQLHGPYDQMSVDIESQNALIEMINSHDWRVGKRHGLINVF